MTLQLPKQYAETLKKTMNNAGIVKMLDAILLFYSQLWIYPRGQRDFITNKRGKTKKFEKSSIYYYVEAVKSYL